MTNEKYIEDIHYSWIVFRFIILFMLNVLVSMISYETQCFACTCEWPSFADKKSKLFKKFKRPQLRFQSETAM